MRLPEELRCSVGRAKARSAVPAAQHAGTLRFARPTRRCVDLGRRGPKVRPNEQAREDAMNELVSPVIGLHTALGARYMSGFGNTFETEALPGALPVGRNSPQKVNYGLYAEQLSGSPFTAPQASNERSWLYRIRPGVRHTARFERIDAGLIRTAPQRESDAPIAQLRWGPTPLPSEKLS